MLTGHLSILSNQAAIHLSGL